VGANSQQIPPMPSASTAGHHNPLHQALGGFGMSIDQQMALWLAQQQQHVPPVPPVVRKYYLLESGVRLTLCRIGWNEFRQVSDRLGFAAPIGIPAYWSRSPDGHDCFYPIPQDWDCVSEERYPNYPHPLQQMAPWLVAREPITPEANARARELLLMHCTPKQRASWERNGTMVVRGSAGGEYRLTDDHIGVERPSDHTRFCLVITGDAVPAEDVVLARKMLIEANEPEFLRVANAFPANPIVSRALGQYHGLVVHEGSRPWHQRVLDWLGGF
jgi:hypothetical protein